MVLCITLLDQQIQAPYSAIALGEIMPDVAPLEIASISKSFHDQTVLDAISFSLMPGEVFGLIGLNGIGKTTLIKIILDLLNADSGEARLFGISSKQANARQALSYLPEKFLPSRALKGHEFLRLSQSFYGNAYVPEQAEAEAKKLDLDPSALAHRVSSYSKGMGQKLGLIGAFLVDSPLLILDEPMSGLDPKARIRVKQRMLEAKAAGKTVFFSSHILADMDEICDRVGILHGGILRFIGTPSGFKQTYPNHTLEEAFLLAIDAPAAA